MFQRGSCAAQIYLYLLCPEVDLMCPWPYLWSQAGASPGRQKAMDSPVLFCLPSWVWLPSSSENHLFCWYLQFW